MKRTFFFILLASVMLSGCTSVKQMTFAVGADQNMSLSDYPEFKIQEGDEIFVYVAASNPIAAEPFNSEYSYYVSKDGTIQLPMLEPITVLGLTLTETKMKVLAQLEDKLIEPFVIVKFASASISILGEVKSPQQLVVTRPVTIFEAIGAANGLTRNACYTQVEVLRTENQEVKKTIVDLTSPDVVKSPCYYLLKGDVVNVRPLRSVFAK